MVRKLVVLMAMMEVPYIIHRNISHTFSYTRTAVHGIKKILPAVHGVIISYFPTFQKYMAIKAKIHTCPLSKIKIKQQHLQKFITIILLITNQQTTQLQHNYNATQHNTTQYNARQRIALHYTTLHHTHA